MNFLISERGGLPERCDFCTQPYVDGRYPVPEEGRAWACNECEARWNADDAAAVAAGRITRIEGPG